MTSRADTEYLPRAGMTAAEFLEGAGFTRVDQPNTVDGDLWERGGTRYSYELAWHIAGQEWQANVEAMYDPTVQTLDLG